VQTPKSSVRTLALRVRFCRRPSDARAALSSGAARWQGDPVDELTLRRNVLEVRWVDGRWRCGLVSVSRADGRRG
jgi:hypothetical protein